MARRVVITGIGVLSPIGSSTEAFWRACLEGRTRVEPIPAHWTRYAEYRSRIWAPLPALDLLARGITRIETLQNDPFTLIACAAAHEALANAGLSITQKDRRRNTFEVAGVDPWRSGVYLGTGVGGAHSFLANHSHQVLARPLSELGELAEALDSDAAEGLAAVVGALPHPPRFHPFAVSMLMPNAAGASLGIKFSCHGPNETFAAACAAGTVALGHAFEAIAAGEVDFALAGGSEYLDDHYGGIFQGFDIAGTLVRECDPPEAANRPFDRRRSGFLFAQGGSAVLVLEPLERAIERGAPIVAEPIGFAQTFDAHSMMSIAPDGEAIERMLRKALERAGLAPGQVQYVNAHGTGTEKNDEIECAVIERVFGRGVHVNSTKSLTGHLIGASGALEGAVTALSLRHQTTHASRNLDDPIADLAFVREPAPFELEHAVSQSFAFGGHNAVLVMRRYGS